MRHGPRRTTVADSCGFPGKRRRGGNLPPGKFSWVASWAMHPHFLFRLAEKKTGRTRKGYAASVSGKAANGCAVHGPKEKAAWAHSGAVALRAHGGRRIGASADLGLPSGTLSSSARSMLPSRGGRCRPRRGARTHLTSFSFRAFRFATRCPGGRGGLYQQADEGVRPYNGAMDFGIPVGADALIGPLQKPHQPPVSGSEKRSRMYPRLPRARGFPKGSAFPSLTAARDRQPSPAGGRRSARAQTDPPNIFSFPPGAAHFLFDVSKRKWGAHPPWKRPLAGASPPVAAVRRPISPGG